MVYSTRRFDLKLALFMLRFYGSVNTMGSCRARSVYLTTHLLGRLSPLSGLPVLCTFFCQRLATALLDSAEGKEWEKNDQISMKECCRRGGGQTRNLLITSKTRIQLSHRDRLVQLRTVVVTNPSPEYE